MNCTPWNPNQSPVVPLLGQLLGGISTVAPEKASQLPALLARVNLIVDDAPGFVFRSRGNSDPREVRASVVVLEFLWAISYAHVATYNWAKRSERLTFQSADQQETASAAGLLRFAFEDRLGPAAPICAMPRSLPQPAFFVAGATTEPGTVELATEIFACATAWILHHELGHVALGHLDELMTTLNQERDADMAATSWLLDGVTDPLVVTKRGIGVSVAVVALSSLSLVNGPDPRLLTRYPTAGQRVMDALTHAAFGGEHQVHEFACFALKVHLDERGVHVGEGPFDTAFDCLYHYCRALTDFERS